jgi:hypothetical protein
LIQARSEKSLRAFFFVPLLRRLSLSNRTFSKSAGLVAGGLPVAGYVDRIPEPVLSVSNAAAAAAATASGMETEFAFGAQFFREI